MDLTEIRIELPKHNYDPTDTRTALLACFSLVFDRELVMHSVKLIQGKSNIFLAMPNERKHDHCPRCKSKNHLLANYCNNCGTVLKKDRHLHLFPSTDTKNRLYNDLVHPITTDLREYLLTECLNSYNQEKSTPGSVLPLQRDEQKRTG